MKTTNVLLGLIVLVIIIIGFFALKKPVVQAPVDTTATTSQPTMGQTATTEKTSTNFTGVDSEGNAVIGDGPIPATIAQAQVFRVSIKNYNYVNASTGKMVEGILPGPHEIVWTNNDSMAHTVTFDNGMVDSGPIQPGKSFAFYFTKAGTYTYHCTYHPNMKGRLIIE